MEHEVESYMQPTAKAIKQGKSLLNLEHLHSVKFHHISADVKCCFIHCRRVRGEKSSNKHYVLWVSRR